MTRDKAEKIVGAIIDDLSDRVGLREEWGQINGEIQQEIIGEWVNIVMKYAEEET